LTPSSNQREAIRMLAERISDAQSTDELLALLEQIVSSCSEVISAILTKSGSDQLDTSAGHILSN